ncbi:MAG: hypothetical protein AAFX01_13065 [Cyanobacteria bacterium J06638_28]
MSNAPYVSQTDQVGHRDRAIALSTDYSVMVRQARASLITATLLMTAAKFPVVPRF